MRKVTDFSELVGQTITSVKGGVGDDEIMLSTNNGTKYRLYHGQDCCESVTVEDICGNIDDIIDSPVLSAEESSSDVNPEGVQIPEYQDSFTWTFYKIATQKGGITIRWYGESNGYYSESVDFEEVE